MPALHFGGPHSFIIKSPKWKRELILPEVISFHIADDYDELDCRCAVASLRVDFRD